MLNNQFLEKLLLKLKSSDARSIHLNALPSNFGRIDIFDFVNIHQSLHLQFLQQLLTTQNFKFSISIDTTLLEQKNEEEKKVLKQLIKKCNHLYYQEEESEQEHGYHSFGFGYPLLIKRDPANKDKIIKAPLFIWYLNIEKDLRKTNTWTISRNEDLPVVLNPVLISYLQNADRVSFKELEALIDDEILSEKELIEAVQLITEKLGSAQSVDNLVATILPCTNKESIEILTKDSAWIRFSGVFGLYKTIKQSIINDVESIIEADSLKNILEEKHELNHPSILSSIALDDTQEEILFALQNHQKIIIQGPPGTGKSQTLTAIITNALLNEKKVLVVCEKKTALEVLQQNLKNINVDDLSVLIEDVYIDRRKIVEKVRADIEQLEDNLPRFRNHDFEANKQNFIALRTSINNAINSTQKPFFGDDTIQDLIIFSDKLEQDINQSTSNNIQQHIKNSLFEFNFEEYHALENNIINAETLNKTNTKKEIFVDINDAIYLEKNLKEIKNSITEKYSTTTALLQSINKHQSQSCYNILNGFMHYAYVFLSFFSANKKQALQQQEEDIYTYKTLKSTWATDKLFDFDFNENTPTNNIQAYKIILEQFLEKITPLQQHLENFESHYNWKKYYLNQNQKTQHLIAILSIKLQENWEKYFNHWYINQVIHKYIFDNNLHQLDAKNMLALKTNDENLRTILSEKINSIWKNKKQIAIKSKDVSNLKYLYNLRKNKQFESKNTLRKIVQDDIDFFTTCFPVILTNPSVCTSIFPAQTYFDIIILDEASQLRIEETFTSLLRGKQHIISGDKHQMPPSNFFGNTALFWTEESENETSDFLADSQSLLEYADDAGYKNHYIDFHYRSKHPDLIQFSNHAFYQSRLIPMPATNPDQAIVFLEINGIYEKGINEAEANALVEYIYNLDISIQTPSVGIGTFNIYQRDLILDLLYEQASKDNKKNKHLEALLSKNLFVKNLENIQGDERDILLLSTTFGKNKDGKFRQLFGPLSQEKGYKLLNVIISRAKEKVIIFSSIPQEFIQKFPEEISQKGNTGKGILYAYLAYAKAVSENNMQQKSFVIQQIQQTNTIQKNLNNNNQYIEFIYQELKDKYGENIHKNYVLGGLILNLVLIKNNNVLLYFHLIDMPKIEKNSNYRQHLHLEKMLLNYNIKTVNISCYQWKTERENIFISINKILEIA
jgi:DNA polymerase III delta prime subunit/DNA-binding cell septation regulator SpoVG